MRVAFVVCEPDKWSLGPLFDALAADPGFAPGFVCTLSDVAQRLPAAARQDRQEAVRAFFARRGPLWPDLYDTGTDRMRPLAVLQADLAVIQQPWGLQDLPRRLAPRMPCAYVHYGFQVIENERGQFGLPDFHPWLWCHAVPTELQAALARAADPGADARLLVAGYPKLDVYRRPAPARTAVALWPHASDGQRRRVIWAPHHTVGRGGLALGTWDWSAPAMLALTAAHPEVDVVLRPHPNLGHELVRTGRMTAEGWARWLAAWQAAPNRGLSEGGDYFDLFRSSDALITDSGSFLAEYLPAGGALIRLERPDAAPLNAMGRALAPAFHRAHDADGLARLFARVVVTGDDGLAPARARAASLVMPGHRPAAEAVLAHFRAAFA